MRCKRLLALLLCGWSGYAITAPAPCSEPAYRDFDFWIGRWDVHLANGTTAGSNHIAQAENGCLLVENWMGVKGSTGSSMNFYDPVADQWQQIWVSPGVIIDIRGGLEGAAEHKDASMILEGFITYTGIGEPFKGVWTLLDDGRVRQFFAESREPGQWKPWFEGFYSRIVGEEAEPAPADG